MKRHGILGAAALLAAFCAASTATADTILVNPGESIQDAIDAALPGDRIEVQPGTYVEDIDFGGKAVTVVGTGPDTVLHGTGTAAVVSFVSGEGLDSVLDSMVIRGGAASVGAGVNIVGSSPTVVRNIIIENVAELRGSGIYLRDSSADILNNLILYNYNSLGDPHAIQMTNSTPRVHNNSIIRNDSNGIFISGGSAADVKNNLIIRNGSRGRGRGICDFTTGTEISYSLFWKNRKSALLTAGRDFKKIIKAENLFGAPRLMGNVDGNPELLLRNPPKFESRRYELLTVADMAAMFRPNPLGRRLRLVDAGDPDPAFNDRDGSRNDIGFTGGPESPLW